MLSFLLESAFCLAALYLVYHLALRRETFFQWNRAYLLLAPVFSFVVPALHVELQPAAKPPAAEPGVPVADALPVLVERVQAGPRLVRDTMDAPLWSFTIGDLLMAIYLAVAGVLAVRLLVQIVHLVRFITARPRPAAAAATPVASFFGFVIWQSRSETDTARRLMWQHEQVHVRQWHSLDVLLIEALIVVQWFNPLLYLYRRSLREVHEFLADAAVVRQCGSRRTYAELLVEQSRKPQLPAAALATTFHSLLKTRLTMLAKQPSRPWRRVKFLLALPLAGALMLLFSFRFIEKLPAAAPLREAVERAQMYTATLAETTVLAPFVAPEPSAYNFYWGAMQVKLEHWPATDRWVGELQSSPDLLREALKREPRLWNGQGLEQHTRLTINGLPVRSDYNDPTVYAQYRPALDGLLNDLRPESSVQITGLLLPNGKSATITIRLDGATPNWVRSSEVHAATPLIDMVFAGAKEEEIMYWDDDAEVLNRGFMTVDEVLTTIRRTPVLVFPASFSRIDTVHNVLDGTVRYVDRSRTAGRVQLDKFELMVQDRTGQELASYSAGLEGSDLAQIREKFGQLRDQLVPGCIISLNASDGQWTDPADHKSLRIPYRTVLSTQVVAEGDPRLALRRSDRRDYYLQWGNFTPRIPRLYARAFTIGNARTPADIALEQTIFNLNRREILEMLRLPLRVFREKQPLAPVTFSLEYRGETYASVDGAVPEGLIDLLTRELQPHDLLRLRLAEAGDANLLGQSFAFDVLPEDPKPPLHQSAKPGAPADLPISVTPNPGSGPFTLSVKVPAATTARVSVLNADGNVRHSFSTELPAGRSTVALPAGSTPAKGAVLVRVECALGRGTAKLIIE